MKLDREEKYHGEQISKIVYDGGPVGDPDGRRQDDMYNEYGNGLFQLRSAAAGTSVS